MSDTRDTPVRRAGIALSSLTVMGGFVASKAIGLVRQAIVTRAFGAGAELDAYYAAFKLPDLLLTLIAGGAIASAFIPLFAGYLARGERARAWKMASATLNVLLLTMGTLAFAAALVAPWVVRVFVAPGFSPPQQALTAELLRTVLLSSVLFAASSLVMSVLQAHNRFLLPAIADFFYDVGIIGGALFLVPKWGIRGLAWGVVAGALLHLLIQVPGLIRVQARYTLTVRTQDRGLLDLLVLMGPRIAILGLFQLVLLLTTNLASRMAAGSITAINLGWIVMQMPEVIFGMAIATAVFPTLSRLATQGDLETLKVTVSNALRAILALTLPSVLALLLLGRSYLAVLFGTQAMKQVVWTTAAFSAGLLGHSLLELAARIFYAHKDTLTPFYVALGATAVNVSLCLILGPVWGAAGLALANSIAVSLQSALLLWLGWRSRVRFDWRPIGRLCLHTILALVGMFLVTWLVMRQTAALGDLYVALLGSAAGGVVYVAVMVALNRQDALAALRAVREKLGI